MTKINFYENACIQDKITQRVQIRQKKLGIKPVCVCVYFKTCLSGQEVGNSLNSRLGKEILISA